MEVSFTYERGDLAELGKYIFLHVPRYRNPIVICLGVLLGGPFLIVLAGSGSVAEAIFLALLFGLPVSIVAWWSSLRQLTSVASDTPGVLGNHTIAFGPEGLRDRTLANDELIVWNSVTGVTEDKNYIYVMIGAGKCSHIPKRSFSSQEEARHFRDSVISHWQRASQPQPGR